MRRTVYRHPFPISPPLIEMNAKPIPSRECVDSRREAALVHKEIEHKGKITGDVIAQHGDWRWIVLPSRELPTNKHTTGLL
jgi:hypothetical protein